MSDADRPGLLRPLAVDGDVEFVAIDDPKVAQQAAAVFATQWDYVHGYVDATALATLPASIAGRRVERDPQALDHMARVGSFDVEELYRELYE
jgi:hypothetical protein